MNESDSFEQEKTDGISAQVDALQGFLDEQGLSGGRSAAADGGHDGSPQDTPSDDAPSQDAPFDRAVSEVSSRWTSHSGEAPEHQPVAVHPAESSDDGGVDDDAGVDDRWEPVTAPDGEELDAGGGSSDGSGSGQDAGSMT